MARSSLHPDWRVEFERWAERFTEPLRHKVRQKWAHAYVCGLLLPGQRKSVEPMAQRVAKGHRDALHHFVAISPWQTEPLERALCAEATRLVGGDDAYLLIDDTALVKKGEHSVGVAHQYCGELGKNANCQALVTTTLARGEVPLCVGMRLYLPQDWASDEERRLEAGVPEEIFFKEKWRIALDEIDRVMAQGTRFGMVDADAGYGACAEFRKGLSERNITWAVGINSTQKVYPADVRLLPAPRSPKGGRSAKHPVPSVPSVAARDLLATLKWRRITWRRGTKAALHCQFCAVRVRVADGPKMARAQHLPGDAEVWLIGERRKTGQTKYHLSNLPAKASRLDLARVIKARWVCEQPHQQMKEELGLDHYEGRSWQGLHHHLLLCQIAYAFLQHLRLGGKKNGDSRMARRPSRRSPRSAAGLSRT